MEDILPKLGLIIGAFFCISPLPMLLKAVTGDKQALSSLSLPGAFMGLCCSTSILAFCQMKDMTDCVTSCWMFVASGVLTFIVYSLVNGAFLSFFAIMGFQAALGYSVFNVLNDAQTNSLNLFLNTLSCTLMPLDQLDKLLKYRDVKYTSYLMNTLAAINDVIWGLYHTQMGTVLNLPNWAGLACEIVLLFGILYAKGIIGPNNPLVLFAKFWVFAFFNLPKKILTGGASSDSVDEKDANAKSTPQNGESKKNK